MVTSAILFSLLTLVLGQDDVIYPSSLGQQRLATRIHCQVEETQHFRYSSVTKLWGSSGGDIILTADVALHCLGDDRGGKYESEALKYLAEISNLIIEEKTEVKSEEPSQQLRRKRGAGDFFTNTWNKIKKFFNRVFRGDRQPDGPPAEAEEDAVDKRKESEDEEDEDEGGARDLTSLYSVPFQFLQLANGSVPEIRFADNEVADGSVRNMKRHLVDAFATQLNFEQRQKNVVETTVTGEHMSSYNITVSGETIPMSFAAMSLLSQKEEPTVTVEKRVTGEDIRRLAPSEAPNDRDGMRLTLTQTQVFRSGRMLSSSGTSSIVLLNDNEMRRKKRDNEEDVTSHFHAQSSFDIRLRRRKRRSAEEAKLHANLTFRPASRLAEKEGSSDRLELRRLQQASGEDIAKVFEYLMRSQGDDYDQKMQLMSEMVHREVDLKLDNEPGSTSNVVRTELSGEVMENMCVNNFTVCKDFLELLAVAGGPKAESVFLSFLRDKTSLAPVQLRAIAGILSDLTSPSVDFLNSLIRLISEKRLDPDVLGSVCLGTGSLGSSAEPKTKSEISKTLVNLLGEQKNHCDSDALLLDILEAVGNLGCRKTIPTVLEVSRNCRESGAVQIACAHALRHHSDTSSVQRWMRDMTSRSDCEVTKAIVGALLDKVQEQQVAGDTTSWPRNGFREVDENLKRLLVKSRCPVEDTILYFGRKRDPVANGIARDYFGPEVEPWDPGSGSRQKRALWDDLNCQEWAEGDERFRPIQDGDEFAADRALYNKRRSCLAYRRLGVKGANAEIYAGVFAGVQEPSDPPKYKLFTKFVSGLNFLGHKLEIGSFYFYHRSGETKAYVRILGQTRQELRHDGCTPTELKYRPIKHIPLYLVNVASLQLSLGIHLSSRLALGTDCPGNGTYQLEPMTDVRVGGEALGTVGMARGGVNLSGTFNYKLRFTFTPTPNMCLSGSHGYDPMNIGFETYYQLWNALKDDWGKHRTWRPSFLSWDVTKGALKSWFKDTCIRTLQENSAPESV